MLIHMIKINCKIAARTLKIPNCKVVKMSVKISTYLNEKYGIYHKYIAIYTPAVCMPLPVPLSLSLLLCVCVCECFAA